MIRFIDLTKPYFCVEENNDDCASPLCAFISTSDDIFLSSPAGGHVFHALDDIEEHPQASRLLALVPKGFFDERTNQQATDLGNLRKD